MVQPSKNQIACRMGGKNYFQNIRFVISQRKWEGAGWICLPSINKAYCGEIKQFKNW